MTVYNCPKGHSSTEPDYCSECGAKIQGDSLLESAVKHSSVTLSSPLFSAPSDGLNCPECTAPHDPDSGDFCEICGYNFRTGTSGEIPPVTPVNPVITPAPTIDKIPVFYEIIVAIDPSLKTPESPEPPPQAPYIISLDKESNLIGRTSDRRGIYPEIPLDFDDAISHRHGLIIRQPNGELFLRDVGSSNGTQLNGIDVPHLVDKPLKEGDVITLGHWTKLTIKNKNSAQ
jgi:FHA domain